MTLHTLPVENLKFTVLIASHALSLVVEFFVCILVKLFVCVVVEGLLQLPKTINVQACDISDTHHRKCDCTVRK